MELDQQVFSVRGCVESALDVLAEKAVAQEAGPHLQRAQPLVPDAIVCDPTRLRQVIINLLSNAVKFTSVGEVIVSVEAEEVEEVDEQSAVRFTTPASHIGGAASPPSSSRSVGRPRLMGERTYQLHFRVEDSGIGIDADKVDKLFKTFSQVSLNVTRRFGGTGLGLAISKHLAELMGGRMWYEARKEGGSAFNFTVKQHFTHTHTHTTLSSTLQEALNYGTHSAVCSCYCCCVCLCVCVLGNCAGLVSQDTALPARPRPQPCREEAADREEVTTTTPHIVQPCTKPSRRSLPFV